MHEDLRWILFSMPLHVPTRYIKCHIPCFKLSIVCCNSTSGRSVREAELEEAHSIHTGELFF